MKYTPVGYCVPWQVAYINKFAFGCFISPLSSDVAETNIKSVGDKSLANSFSVFIQLSFPFSPCPVCA
jgi:hypothetical protein